MTALLRAVTIGDPAEPATVLGPLISAKERDRVEGMIRQGMAEGATLAAQALHDQDRDETRDAVVQAVRMLV